MSKYVCEECGQGPEKDGVALYRTGKRGPGEDPHWRCSTHLPQGEHLNPDQIVDIQVIEIASLIESDSRLKH